MRRSARIVLVVAMLAGCLAVVGAPAAVSASTAWPHTVVAGFSTPDGGGYWLVYADGAVTTNGDARLYGDASNLALNAPMVGGAATSSGNGYWLVAADGGVFTYGDARFFGSMGSVPLNAPVFFIAPTRTGNGYTLVAHDGGVFAFGDAHFYGSGAGSRSSGIPIVGAVTTPGDAGYALYSQDGGHFDFGKVLVPWPDRGYDHAVTVMGVAPTPAHKGFFVVLNFGSLDRVSSMGIAPFLPRAVVGGVRYIFSNPVQDGYVLIAKSGALIRVGAAPGH